MDGFSITGEEIEREGHRFDVTASLDMRPTCRNITDNEEHLSKLALSCAGQADGWGFFRS
ncbi:regulator of ribonuclease activity B [Neorhizobium sp. JUb45]|nr:regulator of ribonuclease activity B [Neorhizobium sp. JUb45]